MRIAKLLGIGFALTLCVGLSGFAGETDAGLRRISCANLMVFAPVNGVSDADVCRSHGGVASAEHAEAQLTSVPPPKSAAARKSWLKAAAAIRSSRTSPTDFAAPSESRESSWPAASPIPSSRLYMDAMLYMVAATKGGFP